MIQKKTLLFIILIVFLTAVASLAGDYIGKRSTPSSIELVRKVAVAAAERKWGTSRIVSWEIYNTPTAYSGAYVFVFYKGNQALPDISKIKKKVVQARIVRLRAEGLTKKGVNLKDQNKLQDARILIADGWKKMRQEEEFGTVIVQDVSGPRSVIMIYNGLPFHIVAMEDAKEIAKSELATEQVTLSRLVYVPPLSFWFEFLSSDEISILVSPQTFQVATPKELF